MKAVKEDPKPSIKLLITPLALQSIQLRSVKRREKDNNTESDHIKPQEPGLDLLQDLKAQTLEPPTVLPLTNSPPDEKLCRPSASCVLKDLSICGNATDDTPSLAYPNGKSEAQCDHLLNGGVNVDCHLSFSSPPQSCQGSPVKQKPPAVSKKPQISFVPPFSAQPLNGHLDRDTTSLSQTEDRTDATQLQTANEEEEEEEEDIKTELQQSLESCSTSAASPSEPAPASQDAHLGNGPCVNGETLEEEAEEDGDSSIAESLSSKEDDNGKSH